MRTILRVISVVALIMLSGCQAAGRDSLLRLTFQVVDDEGRAVEAAKAGFGGAGRPKSADKEGAAARIDGLTNTRGIFTGEVAVWDATQAGYEVSKPGYYTSWASFYAYPPVRGKWQPWNPTIKVVLKRIKNPVPMYAKKLALALPALDEPVGYDFLMGDWVIPHGRGKVPDATFVGNSRSEGDRKFDWQLQVTFTNRGDGIQRFAPDSEPAVFRSAYEAPAEGYMAEWKLRRQRNGPDESEQTTFDHKAGYYFRVRTELDKDGKVVKALYGKIYGDFFDMIYYVNPDGTRNIEFDPKQNLLKPGNNGKRDDYAVGRP